MKYLTNNGWTELKRDVPIAQAYIDLIAISPQQEVYGFRFLKRWKNITQQQIQQSWEKGLKDIYYYIIHSNEIEYEKSIEKWVGVFISGDKRMIPVKRSHLDQEIGTWQFYPNELLILNEAIISSLSENDALEAFLDISVGFKEKLDIIEKDGSLTKDDVVEYLQIAKKKEPKLEITTIEEIIIGDLITGGLIAGSILVLVDYLSESQEWDRWIPGIILLGIGIVSIFLWRTIKKCIRKTK